MARAAWSVAQAAFVIRFKKRLIIAFLDAKCAPMAPNCAPRARQLYGLRPRQLYGLRPRQLYGLRPRQLYGLRPRAIPAGAKPARALVGALCGAQKQRRHQARLDGAVGRGLLAL